MQKIADKVAQNKFEIVVLFLPVSHAEACPIVMVEDIIRQTLQRRTLLLTYLM